MLVGELVRVVERVSHAGRGPGSDLRAEPDATRGDRVVNRGEGLAEHQLHRDEVLLRVGADLEGPHDARMDEPLDQLSLLQEHLDEARIGRGVVARDLQRDHVRRIGRGVDAATEVDGAHPAARDLRDDLPLPEARRAIRARCP